MDKLYIIVRSDLNPGMQLAQSCHALRAFIDDHPEEERSWHHDSNNLVVLQVPSEEALEDLCASIYYEDIPVSCFREPDLDDELTAIAAGPAAKRLLRELPLALHERRPHQGSCTTAVTVPAWAHGATVS